MKNIRTYLYSVLLLCAGTLSACNDDPETEPAYVETGAPTFTANKRGLAADGETLHIDVKSNTYWIIRQQEADDWFTLSPQAGSGSREVAVTIAANTGQERSATLVFETEHGQMQRITLWQEGHGNTIRFFNDDFGTGASALPVVQFEGWNRNGIGSLRCQYWGNDVNADSGQASSGYVGASGGNGIVFAADSANFILGGIALKGDINFNLSFGCMTSQAAFDPAQFQVFFSKDRVNWTPIAYDRSSGAGWEAVNIPFYLPEGVDQLYIRFLGRKAGAYRLDDVTLAEGDGRGETITFVEDIVEYEEIPVFNEAFDWCVGPNSTLPGNDGSNMTTVSNRNGWEGNLVYMHSGFPKIGTSSGLGYLTSPAMAAVGEKRVDVTVTFNVAIMGSDQSDMQLIVLNSGSVEGSESKTFTIESDNYWETRSCVVNGATKETRIRFSAIRAKGNRFYIDNVKASFTEVKEKS